MCKLTARFGAKLLSLETRNLMVARMRFKQALRAGGFDQVTLTRNGLVLQSWTRGA